MNTKTDSHLTRILFILTILLVLASLWMYNANRNTVVPETWGVAEGMRNSFGQILDTFIFHGFALMTTAIGVLIVTRHPRNLIGWLLCLAGVTLGMSGFSKEIAIYANFTVYGATPGGPYTALMMNWLWAIPYTLYFLTMAIFPDGRLPSKRWRRVLWLIAIFAVGIILSSFIEQPMGSAFYIDNPLQVPESNTLFNILSFSAISSIILAAIGATIMMIIRYRKAPSDVRQQIKWLAVSVALTMIAATVGIILAFGFDSKVAQPIVNYSIAFLLLGIGIAILRYRLYDIDVIIHRTLI